MENCGKGTYLTNSLHCKHMQLPTEVQSVLETLETAGFAAYAVGGCVRDLLLGREPADWDVTTAASPEDIQKLFPKNFYNNRFGTVTVRRPFEGFGRQAVQQESLAPTTEKGIEEIEVTTYRIDGNYSDQRHPDEVEFTDKLAEDLARRDFTINAMALNHAGSRVNSALQRICGDWLIDLQVIDPFGGLTGFRCEVVAGGRGSGERGLVKIACEFCGQCDWRRSWALRLKRRR